MPIWFRLSQIYGFVNPINLRMGYGASIHSMAKEVNKYVMENKTNEIPDEIMNHIKEGFYLPYIGHANNTYELMRKKAETCIEKFVKEMVNSLVKLNMWRNILRLHLEKIFW